MEDINSRGLSRNILSDVDVFRGLVIFPQGAQIPSTPGSPTIRDPFGNASDILLSPSPRGVIPSRFTNSAVFRKNSALCRSEGLATSTSDPAREYARCTAFAAATVDLPHCREQFKIPRFASDRSTSACRSSGSNSKRVRANSTASKTSWLALTSRFFVRTPPKYVPVTPAN